MPQTKLKCQNTCTRADTEELTDSEYHELLAVEQRRTTLDVLANSTAPVELADLATTVAERETDVSVPDEATVERVAVALHHKHLPKMAELGSVDYDPTESRVESCP